MAAKFFIFMVFLAIKFALWFFTVLFKLEPLRTEEWKPPPQRPRNRVGRADEHERNKIRYRGDIVAVSHRLKGVLSKGENEDRIDFSRFRTDYSAFISTRSGIHTLRIVSYWPQPDFRMKVFPARRKRDKPYQSFDDIEVGFRQFDRDFIVQSDDPKSVKTILNRKVTRRIAKHRKSAHGRIDIDIAGGIIKLGGKSTRLLKHSQMIAIIENFALIHQLMLDSSEMAIPVPSLPVQGLQMSYIEKRTAICMVCGLVVGSEGVSCVKCETQHHRDCWKYIGKCSTYACRSQNAR